MKHDKDYTQSLVNSIKREIETFKHPPLSESQQQQQLIKDIQNAEGPAKMIRRAESGMYEQYLSPYAMPRHKLIADCEDSNLPELAQNAREGAYHR